MKLLCERKVPKSTTFLHYLQHHLGKIDVEIYGVKLKSFPPLALGLWAYTL